MATITIRGLSEDVKARLRVRAAEHGHSMEAEARSILGREVGAAPERGGLGSRIHERFADVGGVELEAPERSESPRAAELPS